MHKLTGIRSKPAMIVNVFSLKALFQSFGQTSKNPVYNCDFKRNNTPLHIYLNTILQKCEII